MSEKARKVFGRSSLVLVVVAGLVAGGVVLAASVPGVRKVSYEKFADTGIEPKTKKVRLDPTRGWAGSDVFLKEGDLVSITAEGLIDPGVRIKRGPDGQGRDHLKEMTHNCRYMELLGRIGDGPPFCVGAAATFEVIEGGHLSFHVNELDSIRFDDTGHFDISVRWVQPGDKTAKTGAKGPELTAALDLVPINVSEQEARVLSSQIRAHLAATGKYIIIDENQVEEARKRMRINRSDLSNPQTAARLGNNVGASTVVTGQVGKIGNSYSITLQRVNPKTGAVVSTVAEVLDCHPSQIPERLGAAVKKL